MPCFCWSYIFFSSDHLLLDTDNSYWILVFTLIEAFIQMFLLDNLTQISNFLTPENYRKLHARRTKVPTL